MEKIKFEPGKRYYAYQTHGANEPFFFEVKSRTSRSITVVEVAPKLISMYGTAPRQGKKEFEIFNVSALNFSNWVEDQKNGEKHGIKYDEKTNSEYIELPHHFDHDRKLIVLASSYAGEKSVYDYNVYII